MRSPAAILALTLLAGTIAHLPALDTGFLLDDYLHRAMLEGTFPTARHPLDLYNFVHDDDREALRAQGLVPWWAHPELRIAFFRPLSSATAWLDHALGARGPLPGHVHSWLWWVAVVLAARAVFGRALRPRVAALATLIYAAGPWHAMPLAWLANRDALVALAPGLAGLAMLARFVDTHRPRDAALACAGFTAALFAGEYGLGLGGYVLALLVVSREAGRGVRLVGLATFAAPASVYLGVRAALGYGTRGSGFYSDPFDAPATFLAFAPRRLATLVLQGWLSLDADTLGWSTPAWQVALAFALFAPPLALGVARVVAALEPREGHAARWLLAGSLLALPAVIAVVPGPRLLGASALGVAAGAALVIDAAWFPSVRPVRVGVSSLAGLLAVALAFTQLVHGPLTSWVMGSHHRRTSHDFRTNTVALARRLPSLEVADVTMLRAMGSAFFVPFALAPDGGVPARYGVLAQSSHVLVLRTGPRTLELVTAPERGAFPRGENNLFLDAQTPIEAGQTFVASGFTATALVVEEGLVRRVRFDFERDLDAPGRVWLNEGALSYVDAALPTLGLGAPFDP